MEDGKEEDVKAEEAGPPKVKRWANLHPKIRSHTLQQLGIFAGNGIKGASNRGEEKGGRGGGGGGLYKEVLVRGSQWTWYDRGAHSMTLPLAGAVPATWCL